MTISRVFKIIHPVSYYLGKLKNVVIIPILTQIQCRTIFVHIRKHAPNSDQRGHKYI
uniref:Uncharacterized protein n=1 Tax=Arundo donax TaxID=35708 RepID=A0A0A8Z817_ARUDO